jgi:hypothetical protein
MSSPVLSRQPEAICIRVHGDGERELVGGWPELTELSHSLMAEDTLGLIRFDGKRRLDVVVNEEQQQVYRLVSRYWTTDSALFIREDLAVDD